MFLIWENKIVISAILDPQIFLFLNRANRPPCTTLSNNPRLKWLIL